MLSVRRHADVVIAAGAGLATAVVLAGNIDRSFDYDESVAVWSTIRRGSATIAFTETTVFNNHPIFSAWQSVWWALGGAGEVRQRVFPILYGALAVAILAGWAARRFGPRAGVAAGLVLGLNPMFLTQARAVRGYSLAVLGVVVAVVCVLEYVRHDDHRSRAATLLLGGHALGIVVAVGTHAVSLVALGPVGLAALVLIGRIDLRLVASWVAAGIGVGLVYVWTVLELLGTADDRGNRYYDFLGELTLEEVLGRDAVTVAIHGGVIVMAALVLGVSGGSIRARSLSATLVIASLVIAQFLLLWQVVQPLDLYPRFFLGAVPLVAIGVAIAVRHHGAVLLVVIVAAVFVVDDVRTVRASELPLRDAGEIAAAADALELRSCAVGTEAIVLYAGGADVREFDVRVDPAEADFSTCDVFLRIGSWGRPLDPAAADWYPHHVSIGPINVFTQVPPDQLGR